MPVNFICNKVVPSVNLGIQLVQIRPLFLRKSYDLHLILIYSCGACELKK